MTVQTMTPEEVRRHDKRGERDRRCNDCSTPITQYSRSGLCGPCVLRQRAAERVCERCGKGCQPGKTLCARCDYHENGPRAKYASKPTPAQRQAWTTSKQRTSTLKRASEAGFPDILAIRERVVWIELKVLRKGGRGKVMPEQQAFHDMLRHAGQEVHVFWNDDQDWAKLLEVAKR